MFWSQIYTALRLAIALCFVVLFLQMSSSAAAAPTATVTLGTTIISEGNDFATRVLGMPWDMSTDPYPDLSTAFDSINAPSFLSSNGMWSLTTATFGTYFALWPSIKNPLNQQIQKVLKLGDRFPIDPTQHKLLSYRMCIDQNDFARAIWYNDALDQSAASSGQTNWWNTTSGCKIYVIDLSLFSKFQGDWVGTIHGFRLDFASTGGRSVQFDWVRLTTKDTSNTVRIDWSGVTTGTTLNFFLVPGTSCTTTNSMQVGTQPRGGVSSNTFMWGSSLQPNGSSTTPYPLPESFQPGQYTVFMKVDGGAPICASSALTIDKAPILEFQKPSMYSGQDYATQVVGDPWGMSNSQDVASILNLSNSDFTNGIFNGTSSSGDPILFMHVTTPINSTKYSYVTFKYKLDGTQDILNGWVLRIFWTTPSGVVTLREMIIYEGWHIYSIDLPNAPIEDSSASHEAWGVSSPPDFRIDPNENTTGIPWTFHLDFVTLTGGENVKRGTPFPIIYIPTPTAGVTVNFCYDTDTNPANGKTTAIQYTPPGPYRVMLPLLTMNNAAVSEINLLTGSRWLWNTSAVNYGTYYVCADATNGTASATWYSEIPVTITP